MNPVGQFQRVPDASAVGAPRAGDSRLDNHAFGILIVDLAKWIAGGRDLEANVQVQGQITAALSANRGAKKITVDFSGPVNEEDDLKQILASKGIALTVNRYYAVPPSDAGPVRHDDAPPPYEPPPYAAPAHEAPPAEALEGANSQELPVALPEATSWQSIRPERLAPHPIKTQRRPRDLEP